MSLRIRHIVALYYEGLNFRKYDLIKESSSYFKFKNKEDNKIVYIKY